MHSSHPFALRRPGARALLALGLAAALALSMLATVDASSHREAPMITEFPKADNTDVYAFRSPDRPDTVTLISNFIPFEEPGGGPNYYFFDDNTLYEIHVDSDGDAVADVQYEFRSTTQVLDGNTWLAYTGPITSLDDENYNLRQSMDIFEVRDGERTRIGNDVPVPPNNAGPRTTPDYEELAQEAVTDLGNGMTAFAGQREEGFYVDIAAIADLGGLRPFNAAHIIPLEQEDGVDTLAGYNVHSIALQVPIDQLTEGDDPVIGVWSTASKRKVRVFQQSSGALPAHRGEWVQVSRLGNPLVNEVVVPLKVKDVFNTLRPVQDADVFPTIDAPPLSTEGDIPLVTDPILAAQINALYGIDVPPPPRDDLVAVYLTGIEGVNQPESVRPAEMLRLNTSTEPTPVADRDRLGFLAGQADGFPNGRRPGDDVTDISLRAVAGGYPLTPEFNEAPNNELTDGANANDAPYLDEFPYLATPHQGYDLNNPDRVDPEDQQ